MKKLLFLISGTLFMGALAAQSIPNGGFENWSTNTWADPQYFTTSNDRNVPQGLPPNVTETTGYLGVKYGVKLQTIGTPPNTIAGFCVDANVNNGNGLPTGGIPYNQKPTGVRFYYQYTPGPNDTAGVFIIFKKLGVYIDSFLIAITVPENAYTLHSYNPKNPLPATPDTVIVGAASTIKVLRNGGGGNLPVGSTLIIDSITFTGVSSQPAELNGDFQQWVGDTMLFPAGWYASYPGTTRTTDAASGNYAIQMETTSSLANGIQPAQAGTGFYPQHCNNCNEIGGYPYTPTATNKDTLDFAYKYAPKPNDTAMVSLSFIKKGQSVFDVQRFFYTTQATYANVQIPFNLTGVNPVPDTVIVNMISSSHNNDTTGAQYAPFVGSIFKVDNITFASQKATLGINSLSMTEGIKVYPNPANSQINVDLTNVSGSLQRLAIYDMSGRLLSAQTYSGGVRNTLETINITSFANGMYLVEATTSNGKFYQKVCKN